MSQTQTTTVSVEKTQKFSESNDHANSTTIKVEEQSHESRSNDGGSNDLDDLNKYLGPNRKSFQLRALARKTISYQKRQMFINICCITLCPLLMVAISGIMGIVITNLLNNAGSTKEYLFCSDQNASDPITGQFYKLSSDSIPKVPSSSIPNAPGDVSEVGLTNFYLPPAGNQLFSLPGNEDYCVYWFGHDYPFRYPYEPKPTLPDAYRKDTTFRPDPPFGWLNGSSQANQTQLLSLLQYQTFGYAFVADYNGDSGEKPRLPSIPPGALQNLNITTVATNSSGSGLLGTIDTNVFVNVSHDYSVGNLQPVPFFNKFNLDPRGMDDQLTKSIRDVVERLSSVDKSALEQPHPSTETKLNFFIDVAEIVANMPWGNILFDLVDASAKRWNYTLQIGDDIRISNAASYPKQGLRRIAQQSQLSNGFLQTASSNSQSVKITTGYRIMPQLYSSKISVSVGSLVGGILYPFGVSFLLAIFVITLVKEKEERILVMMRMNGLKSFAYYLTHYIHFYSLHIFTTVVFIVAGLIFKLEFFTLTQPGVYIILFFVWGHVQIALAFLFSVFFNKERSALVITFLIVLCGVIIGLASDQLFKGPAPVAYYIWPPFAFYRGLSLVNVASISKLRRPYRMSDLTGDDEVLATIIAMVIAYVVYLGLAFYLAQIIPTEYGISKKWHFFVSEPWRKYRNRKNKKDSNEKEAPATLEAGVPDVDPEETKFEDEDVKAERQRVLDGLYSEDSPLIMKRMRKVYGSGKLAVKDVTFAVEKNLIFGLLGPNGAGKTTLISILTGLYPPTSGSASINNYDVDTNIDKVYMSVGVCPQHDILWDDLTVEEHLLFYARLKGFPAHAESEAVKMALQKVRLEPFKNRLSKGLSGGEKRRLSIAIALVGNPGVVFLDEPTTGLDPEVRRLIWNIIQESKIGRTIILTTHSMEEAEVLCNLIGIMAKGTLRCIGPQLRLKEVYGTGFKLSFSCKAKNVDRATEYIERLLPNGSKLDSFVTNVSYEFVPEKGQISKLFTEIEGHGKRHGIDDWGLSQTSLEEVFLRIIGEADAEAD